MRPVALAITSHHPRAKDDFPALAGALRAAGVQAEAVPWDDADYDWAGRRVHLLSPWDYQRRLPEFLAWCEHVSAVARPLHDAALVRWNIHKRYLLELGARSVPTLPTALARPDDALDLEGLARDWGVDRLVLKPAVGAGAEDLLRWSRGDAPPAVGLARLRARGDFLVQAYAPRVASEGELGVVCIDGVPMHTVEKRPKEGDFRVQPHFGGTNRVRPPTEAERELARAVLTATPHPTRYARVDLIPDLAGAWALGELEVIEPELFLRLAPETAAALAAALAADAP